MYGGASKSPTTKIFPELIVFLTLYFCNNTTCKTGRFYNWDFLSKDKDFIRFFGSIFFQKKCSAPQTRRYFAGFAKNKPMLIIKVVHLEYTR